MSAVRPSPLPLSGFPLILRSTVHYADRPTVVTLLRTSYQLFEIAGPEIYREVYLDHKTIGGIFLGAYKDPTKGRQPEPKRKRGDDTYTKSNAPTAKLAPLPGQEIGKPGLLKHVKIFTITAHRRSDCLPLTLTVPSSLAPDAVRIVCPRTQGGSFVSPLCGEIELCPLLRRIDTRKIVFRNYDYDFGARLDDFSSRWFAASLEEIVYFLPTQGRIDFISSKKAAKIKLVFWRDAEPAPWDWPGDVCDVPAYGLDTIKDSVEDLGRLMHHSRVLEIYGLETILRVQNVQRGGFVPAMITEQQVRSMEKLLQYKLQKTGRTVTEQLIFKTRQQYLRENAYGELSRKEKQRWLEEGAFGSASLDDIASSGPSDGGQP